MMLLEITIYRENFFSTNIILNLHITAYISTWIPVNYCLLSREYSEWNAAVAALQFWTADLEAHILSSAIEQVYNAFF